MLKINRRSSVLLTFSFRHASLSYIEPSYAISGHQLKREHALCCRPVKGVNKWVSQAEVGWFQLRLCVNPSVVHLWHKIPSERRVYHISSVLDASYVDVLRDVYPCSFRTKQPYMREIGKQLLAYALKFNYASQYWISESTVGKMNPLIVSGMGHAVWIFGRKTFFFNAQQVKIRGSSIHNKSTEELGIPATDLDEAYCSNGPPQMNVSHCHITKSVEKPLGHVNALSGEVIQLCRSIGNNAARSTKEWVPKWAIKKLDLEVKPNSKAVAIAERNVTASQKGSYYKMEDVASVDRFRQLQRIYPKSVQKDKHFLCSDGVQLIRIALKKGYTSPYWLTSEDCANLSVSIIRPPFDGVFVSGETFFNAEQTNILSAQGNPSVWPNNAESNYNLRDLSATVSTKNTSQPNQTKPINAITRQALDEISQLPTADFSTNEWVTEHFVQFFQLKLASNARKITIYATDKNPIRKKGFENFYNLQDFSNTAEILRLRSVYPQPLVQKQLFSEHDVLTLLQVAKKKNYSSPYWLTEAECVQRGDTLRCSPKDGVQIGGRTYYNADLINNDELPVQKEGVAAADPQKNLIFESHGAPCPNDTPAHAISGEPLPYAPELVKAKFGRQKWITENDRRIYSLRLFTSARKFTVDALKNGEKHTGEFYNIQAIKDLALLQKLRELYPQPIIPRSRFSEQVARQLLRSTLRNGFSSPSWATSDQWEALQVSLNQKRQGISIGKWTLFNACQTTLHTSENSLWCFSAAKTAAENSFLTLRECTSCYETVYQRMKKNIPAIFRSDFWDMSNLISVASSSPDIHQKAFRCKEPEHVSNRLQHILSHCEYALKTGRYTFRHDTVLAVLIKYIEMNPAIARYRLDIAKFGKKGVSSYPYWVERSGLRPDGWVKLTDGREFVLELTCPWEENVEFKHSYKVAKYTDVILSRRETNPRTSLIAFEITVLGVPHTSVGALRDIIGAGNEVFLTAVEEMAEAAMITSLYLFQCRETAVWKLPTGYLKDRLNELTAIETNTFERFVPGAART